MCLDHIGSAESVSKLSELLRETPYMSKEKQGVGAGWHKLNWWECLSRSVV